MFRPLGRGFPLDRVTPLVFTLKPRLPCGLCRRPEATWFFSLALPIVVGRDLLLAQCLSLVPLGLSVR